METAQKIQEWFKRLKTYQKIFLLLFIILLIILFVLLSIPSEKPAAKNIKNEKPGASSSNLSIPATTDSVKKILENVSENENYKVVIDDRQSEQLKLPTISDISQKIKVTISPDLTSNLTAGQPFRVLLYGIKSQQGIELREVQTDNSNNYAVAYLPANIKDIHPVSDHGLIYIAGVDKFDHGDRIEIFDTQTQKAMILTTVAPGFGIDDIVVSDDNRYVAMWAVKFIPGQKVMQRGLSSIYLFDTKTLEKKLVVAEKANAASPIHYPVFFDKKNRLFLDTWKPNQGFEVYLGFSYINISEPNKLVSIPQLAEGIYVTKPLLSPVNNEIVFTGYDPQAKLKQSFKKIGLRKRDELDNPNQLVVMNLDDFSSQVPTDRENTKFYIDPKWSSDGKSVIYTKFNPLNNPASFEGVFTLNVNSKSEEKIDNLQHASIRILKYYNPEEFIYQKTSRFSGNLGENYHPVAEEIFKYEKGQTTSLVQGVDLQYINNLAVLSDTNKITSLQSFSVMVKPQNIVLPTENPQKSLTLGTFEINPLAFRSDQQNDLIMPSADNSSTNPDISPTITPPVNCDGPPSQRDPSCPRTCIDDWADKCGGWREVNDPCWADYWTSGCQDSPLYLYPRKTMSVIVKPLVSGIIKNEIPKLDTGFWRITAYPDGKIMTNDSLIYNKISYSYTAADQSDPIRGYVVEKSRLADTLTEYAGKIGLNSHELTDFVSFWTSELNKIPSPYYFISHYDKESAAKIMSFDISPKPETFIQVVMYFKPINYPYSVLPPIFEPVPLRNGFTAVDWSGKIDL